MAKNLVTREKEIRTFLEIFPTKQVFEELVIDGIRASFPNFDIITSEAINVEGLYTLLYER